MSNTGKIVLRIRKLLSSSLVRSSGIYTISSFVNAAIPFLLLPVLTSKLTQADFGIVAMFATVVSFMMPFIGINMEGAIARKYYSDEAHISQYIGNCLQISLASTGIMCIIFLFTHNELSAFSAVPSAWLFGAIILCLSQFITLILLTLIQVRIKPLYYGLIQIGQSLLNFSLSIILIVFCDLKWEGRLFAQITAGLLFACIAAFILFRKKEIDFTNNREYKLHALKFGGGLIPHALGGLLIILTNRFFIKNMISLSETGLYSTASQIASIVSFFTVSFNNAFVPWLYKKLNENDENVKRRIVKMTYLYFVGLSIMGLALYVTMPVIFHVFINHKFEDSLKYSGWLVLGFVFQGMYFMVTNYIVYSEKTHLQAIITIVIGLVNIPANYYLISYFGAVGAAMAFAICFLLLFIITWLTSARIYKMPWLPEK